MTLTMKLERKWSVAHVISQTSSNGKTGLYRPLLVILVKHTYYISDMTELLFHFCTGVPQRRPSWSADQIIKIQIPEYANIYIQHLNTGHKISFKTFIKRKNTHYGTGFLLLLFY